MNKKQVIEALKQLQQGNIPCNIVGICTNIKLLIPDSSRDFDACLFLCPYFKTWRYFSGNENYPVPDLGGTLNANKVYYQKNLWKNKQLELRMDLVEHLIKELENE